MAVARTCIIVQEAFARCWRRLLLEEFGIIVAQSMRDNPGTFILNDSAAGEQASVLVTGLGRSGTTMVSRVLSALGLFMGDKVSRGTNEDKEFRNIIKKSKMAEFKRLCRDRDERFDRWGFKYPAARHDLPKLVDSMRSPRVVVTSRDPLATAIRAADATRADVLPTLEDGLRRTLRLMATVEKLPCPVLLLSYEKALTRPRECVSTLAAFCGIAADSETLEAAAKTIRNGDQVYLG